MCRCYDCRWNQPFHSNSGYWHKCICFTCRKVGSHGFNGDTPPGYVCPAELENWPRCSRCNQNMILGGPNFKAPKYKDKKSWEYLKNNWRSIHTIDDFKKHLKEDEERKKLEALKTERYYDWGLHKYMYRIPGTTDNKNGRMEYFNY